MTRLLRAILVVATLFGLVSCGPSTFSGYYSGPQVTAIQVQKANRKMYLLHGDEVLETYDIQLGFDPLGPKHFEGDGKTPEGTYRITHKNPHSSYYLSVGISYPNDADRALAKAQGKEPGGDIFIHGQPARGKTGKDWTVGCIAVTNDEMDMIFAMVQPGTLIYILP